MKMDSVGSDPGLGAPGGVGPKSGGRENVGARFTRSYTKVWRVTTRA